MSPNRHHRRAAARSERRSKQAAALGSAAVLASTGVGAALVLASGTAGAAATTYVVTNTTDSNDGTCDANCSLREAIVAANANAGEDEINFSVTGTITLTSNLPSITDAVHIHGPGASSLTIDGDDSFRVFMFNRIDDTDGTDAVTDLTITGGNATANPDKDGGAIEVYYGTADMLISDVVLTGNYAPKDGGAIQMYQWEGSATIERATITGNSAGSSGGGLYFWGKYAAYTFITITDSVISGNTAAANGGGLYATALSITVTDSVVSGNSAGTLGGGMKIAGSDAAIVRSTVSDNTAGSDGGGVFQGNGYLDVVNSTVSGNTSGRYGGGLSLALYGGTIVQSTISGNTAHQAGAVSLARVGTTIQLSTVAGNTATAPTSGPAVHGILVEGGVGGGSVGAVLEDRNGGKLRPRGPRVAVDPVPAGTLELLGTILAANGDLDVAGAAGDPVDLQSSGSVIGTVDGATVTVTDAGGTQTGVTADALKLGPLADNGGPTETHVLLPDSVAIDAGPAAADLPTFDGSEFDQRGESFARIINGTVDVGALENQTPPPPRPVPDPAPVPDPTFTG